MKTICVKTLSDDKENRYRDWVETNRRYVHEKSGGNVGYVHIPDMGLHGYSKFFRNNLREFEHDGLIVDARYNGGGHVSQLILDYLARRRLGFDKSWWTGVQPYPMYSPSGPLVASTNQYAGSVGDIFPHVFKLLKLGPVIGQRTWGGVSGIYPRTLLADGGITTQPDFSFWFADVGWGVENFGTEPDIVIDIAPHVFFRNEGPQLALS
jgi:tricorn protease